MSYYSGIKPSSKARIVWSRNLEIVELIFIKVPSTLLLEVTVEIVFKFFCHTLLHRYFRYFLFFQIHKSEF